MSEWQPGDLALCVRKENPKSEIRLGAIYTVLHVLPELAWRGGCCETGLVIDGAVNHTTIGRWARSHQGAFGESRFRKINPLTDAEREEALRELNEPVREPVLSLPNPLTGVEQ